MKDDSKSRAARTAVSKKGYTRSKSQMNSLVFMENNKLATNPVSSQRVRSCKNCSPS